MRFFSKKNYKSFFFQKKIISLFFLKALPPEGTHRLEFQKWIVCDSHTICVLPPGMEPTSFRFRRRILPSSGVHTTSIADSHNPVPSCPLRSKSFWAPSLGESNPTHYFRTQKGEPTFASLPRECSLIPLRGKIIPLSPGGDFCGPLLTRWGTMTPKLAIG